jgi:hypothetical protein
VDVGGSAHLLIENVTQDFKKITRADLFEQLINESKHQRANQKADLEAAGLSDAEDGGRWTTFSRKSTEAALRPAHFFPSEIPFDMTLKICKGYCQPAKVLRKYSKLKGTLSYPV